MTDSLSGVVLAVSSQRRGVIGIAWSGTDLTVLDAADVDRDGCDLTPDNGQTLYTCTGEVVDGEVGDPDILTMTSTPPVDWPAGGTDADGQPIPTDTRLDLWPEVLDVVAQVDAGDGDPIPAVVPHALRPLLSEGLRDDDSREQVVCSARGTGWVIDDVIGRRGEIDLDGLAPAVVQSIEAAAASGVRRWDSVNEPDSDGHGAGDLWFQHDTVLTGKTVGQWHWDGTSWIKDQMADAVIANIDAGKIVGGTLSGLAGIYSPSPSSLPRTQIVGSTIQVIRAGREGEEIVTSQLGGTDDDKMMISDTDGSPLGGVDPDGNVLAKDLSVNGDFTVGGVALPDMLSPLPQGIIARQKLGSSSSLNSVSVGGTELGLLELSADLLAGREYEFFVGGNVQASAAGYAALRVRATTAALGSTPEAPTITSPGLLSSIIRLQSGNQEIGWSKILPVQTSDVSVRILLAAQTSSASMSLRFNTSDTQTGDIMITDRGSYGSWSDGAVSNGGGNPSSGTSTNPSSTNPTRTYTKSWTVAATRVWRNGSVVSGYLMQGYYSPGQRYGLWLWDGSIASAVGSSANIQSCILTIKNVDFPATLGGSGILRIGHYDSTSLPGSPQTSGGGAVSVPMKAGQTMKIGLPGGWWGGFASGAIRGISLGEVGSGTENTPTYGHFEPSATITMTYSK